MRIALPILISFFALHAQAGEFAQGVAAEIALGKGGSKIENPDGTMAHYKSLAINLRGLIPLVESESFAMHLIGGGRYIDMENTLNSGGESEVASLIGPGAGLQLRAYKFFVAYEYHFLIGRHYSVGAISHSTKYEMLSTTLSAGLTIPLKQLSVSLSYSQSSGNIPKDSTQLSKDAPYTDQIYWIQLTYSTGASFSKFLEFLF